jgi:hypothetical protein
MAIVKTRRAELRHAGKSFRIGSLEVRAGHDGSGPTVGFHIVVEEKVKATIELSTADAFDLGMNLVGYVPVAHKKHGRWIDRQEEN